MLCVPEKHNIFFPYERALSSPHCLYADVARLDGIAHMLILNAVQAFLNCTYGDACTHTYRVLSWSFML